jgi:hypothetical protein
VPNDPFDQALRRLHGAVGDPLVRAWLERLLRGQSATNHHLRRIPPPDIGPVAPGIGPVLPDIVTMPPDIGSKSPPDAAEPKRKGEK